MLWKSNGVSSAWEHSVLSEREKERKKEGKIERERARLDTQRLHREDYIYYSSTMDKQITVTATSTTPNKYLAIPVSTFAFVSNCSLPLAPPSCTASRPSLCAASYGSSLSSAKPFQVILVPVSHSSDGHPTPRQHSPYDPSHIVSNHLLLHLSFFPVLPH